MSAPSRLKVFVCPECGEQDRSSASRWKRGRDYPGDPEYALHWHGEENRGKPGEFVKAEEVEVIPAADHEGFRERLTSPEAIEALMLAVNNRWAETWPPPRWQGSEFLKSVLSLAIAASENPESTEEGTTNG